jgi:hypothetical protein
MIEGPRRVWSKSTLMQRSPRLGKRSRASWKHLNLVIDPATGKQEEPIHLGGPAFLKH